MSKIELTSTQRQVLEFAVKQPDGRVEWFPDQVKGGARQRVIEGLSKRGWIERQGEDWCLADAGYEVLGRVRPRPSADPELENVVAAAEAQWTQDRPPVARAVRRTRDDSKQAEVIRMLRRPQGATVNQIVEATGWQAHTVRGAFAGTLKKKLGLTIVSDKSQGGERVYRIA